MDQKAFGAFIAELRRAEKLTQRQVADKLHVTDRAVSKWECGLSYPDVTLLEPLADALGIGVGELLTCRRRETDRAEPEMPALHSVLTITQEEKRLRTRRTRIIAIAAAAAAVVLAVLTTMQHNGALLYRQPTTAPNGSITLTVYRDRLLGGQRASDAITVVSDRLGGCASFRWMTGSPLSTHCCGLRTAAICCCAAPPDIAPPRHTCLFGISGNTERIRPSAKERTFTFPSYNSCPATMPTIHTRQRMSRCPLRRRSRCCPPCPEMAGCRRSPCRMPVGSAAAISLR